MDLKLFIIPQTVPNKPMKGAVDPEVAKNVRFFSNISLSVFSSREFVASSKTIIFGF